MSSAPRPHWNAADVSSIAAGRTGLADIDALDVVVSFLPVERTAWAGPIPRHGVWAIIPWTTVGRRVRPTASGSSTVEVRPPRPLSSPWWVGGHA